MYDMKKAEERILEYCAERAREDAVPPEDIACALMNEPGVLRMHGPEHHFLTAASLCAAGAPCAATTPGPGWSACECAARRSRRAFAAITASAATRWPPALF